MVPKLPLRELLMKRFAMIGLAATVAGIRNGNTEAFFAVVPEAISRSPDAPAPRTFRGGLATPCRCSVGETTGRIGRIVKCR